MNPKFTITHAITAALTRIERARGFLEAATLSEEWVRALHPRRGNQAMSYCDKLRHLAMTSYEGRLRRRSPGIYRHNLRQRKATGSGHRTRGIAAVFRSQRITTGKFRNFTPAVQIN